MNWNQIEYVIRSASGQDGVYFVSDGQKQQVLKASPNPAEELFLMLFVSCFSLSVPEIEIIQPETLKYENMITNIKPEIEEENAKIIELQKKESNKEEFYRNQELMEKRILHLQVPHIFFLMSEIKGRSLRDSTSQDLERWYGDDENLNQKGIRFFKDLGKLLIFDILIRNIDRFIFWKLPGIGELEYALGNLGNIMVQDKIHRLTVIDSLSNREIEVTNYVNAVRELVKTFNSETNELVERGKETIELTGYEVKENGKILIREGIEEGLRYIQSQVSRKTVEPIYSHCLQLLPNLEKSKSEKLAELIEFIIIIAEAGFSS